MTKNPKTCNIKTSTNKTANMFFNQTGICCLIENIHGHMYNLSEEWFQKPSISRDYSVRLLTSFLLH